MRQAINNLNTSESVAIVSPIDSRFDDTANDSSKSWTVPEGELWKLNFAHIILVSSADVGNRVISIDILDADGNLMLDLFSPVVQAASGTRHYAFFQGIYRETAFAADSIQIPIPKDLWLKAGYTIKAWDRAAIAAAADDMTVAFQFEKYAV